MPDSNAANAAAVAEAIRAAGSATALGEALGITQQAVSKWTRVPLDRVADVSAATGIPRAALRPDIFGDPPGRGGRPDRRAHR